MANEPEPQAKQDRWRHRHARERAGSLRPTWWTGGRAVVAGAFGGGGIAAAVFHLHVWEWILIGAGSGAAGAYLPWAAVYALSFVAAGGRVVRERLAAIESRLTELAVPAPSSMSTPTPVITVPERVIKVKDQVEVGRRILMRLPRTSMSATVPPELVSEVVRWKKSMAAALTPWPQHKKYFAGPIASEGKFGGYHPLTQEVMTRLGIANEILDDLIEDERTDRDGGT